MSEPSSPRPSQAQLIYPLLETLETLGGRATPIEVADVLATRFRLPDEIANATRVLRDGQVVDVWRRHVRFAREKAKAMGYIASDVRGTWAMTDAGRMGMQHARPAVLLELLVDDTGRARAARFELAVGVPTTHTLVCGDARSLPWIDDGQIPLVVTSVPYFDIKRYEKAPGQLADVNDYEAFLEQLDGILRECLRVLSPGGRLACNVGDVLRSRRMHGEHHVLPLHADILARSTRMGFRALNGILWHKPTNCNFEQSNTGVLGTSGQPNGIVKSEVEHILLLKKPGPYRRTTAAQQRASAISPEEYARWFRPVWSDVSGARTTGTHPAPFPVSIPYRLIRMFSFHQDAVLDVCAGSSTTAVAAARAGRHSICVDVSPTYTEHGIRRLAGLAAKPLAA